MTLVTKGDWGVSYTTGDGIDGCLLNVSRFPDRSDWTNIEYAEKGRPFASIEEASAYALANGYLQEYVPRNFSDQELEDAFGHLKI
jgi:hypothetical protein